MCKAYLDWIAGEGWTWEQTALEIGAANAGQARSYGHGVIPRVPQMRRIYLRSRGLVTPNDYFGLPELPLGTSSDLHPLEEEAAA